MKLTDEQVKEIKREFHKELNREYIACDIGGSLADLVEDALTATLRRLTDEED